MLKFRAIHGRTKKMTEKHCFDLQTSSSIEEEERTLVKRGAEYLRRLGLLLKAIDKTRLRGGFSESKETPLAKGKTRCGGFAAAAVKWSDRVLLQLHIFVSAIFPMGESLVLSGTRREEKTHHTFIYSINSYLVRKIL